MPAISCRTLFLLATIGIVAAFTPISAIAKSSAKPSVSQSQLFASSVKVDITPDDLTNLNPFGGGSFIAVHDPIYARVLLLSNGAQSALIVTFDSPEVGDMVQFRKRIEQQTGIKSDHILLGATHDHSAPRIGGLSKGTRGQMPSIESQNYSVALYEKILSAIQSAKLTLQPARLGYGKGRLNINVSRDQYTPGKGWGLGYDPDGISDDGLPVIRINSANGKPIAIVFAYGVHSTVTFGIKHISGDLAGAAERHIEEFGGEGVVGMFLMGAAGEQIPIVTQGKPKGDDPKYRDLAFRAMDAQGLILGAEVLRISDAIKVDTATVDIAAANVDAVCPTKETKSQMASMSNEQSPEVAIKLSALVLNDIAIGGVGGEVATKIYQRLITQTPLTRTVFATNVNDRIGYIVDDAAYDTPTFEVNGSPVARGCAEDAIANGLSQMFTELQK